MSENDARDLNRQVGSVNSRVELVLAILFPMSIACWVSAFTLMDIKKHLLSCPPSIATTTKP